MDFSVLLSDLRDVAEKYKGKSTEPQVSTLAYVDMFTKILKRAQKVTDKYEDQITVLWVALNQLSAIYKDLSPGTARDNLCRFIFGLCAKTVLNIQWSQLDDDSKVKRNFTSTVENVHEILTEFGFQKFQIILDLMESNWTHPILTQIMSSDEEDLEGGLEYIQQEDPDILKLRIEIMMKENCEEFALNLCTWSLKHPSLTNDLKIKEHQIYMLYKQGEYGKMQEVCESVICHDGIKVMSHLAKIPTNQSLCIRLAQVFLVQDWVKSDRNCCTQELLKLWIHHQYLADKDEERFLDSIWTVAKVSRDTEQIGVLIDGVRRECGDMFIQLYTELCKYALNIDKGNMELEEKQGNTEEIGKRKLRIAKTCVRMAFMLKEYDFRISRISGLTAFSLDPTTENLNLVNKLYWTIKNTSATAANSKVNPATLYEVERLLGLMRPEMLNPDYSWKQLIPICKKYKMDFDAVYPDTCTEGQMEGFTGPAPNHTMQSLLQQTADSVQKQAANTMQQTQPTKRKYTKKKSDQDIEMTHAKQLLQSRNLSREQIEKILSEQFPRNALKELSDGPPLSMKQLDKTIDDLKKSIYKETQYRQVLEKNLPTFSQAKQTAVMKMQGQQDEGQSGSGYVRQHSLPSTSKSTYPTLLQRQLSHGAAAQGQHQSSPSAHTTQVKGHYGSPTEALSVSQQLLQKIQSNPIRTSNPTRTITHPNILRPPDSSQQECAKIAQQIAEMHEKQRAEKEKIEKMRLQGRIDGAKAVLNSRNVPNSSQISELLSLTIKERKALSLQEFHKRLARTNTTNQGKEIQPVKQYEPKTTSATTIPTSIQPAARQSTATGKSEATGQTIATGQSVAKGISMATGQSIATGQSVAKEPSMATGQSIATGQSVVPARSIATGQSSVTDHPQTLQHKSQTAAKGLKAHKYYLTTEKAMNELKRDTAGNINLGSSKVSIKPVFSMVVPKSMTRPEKKEELVKTVTNMVKKASSRPAIQSRVTHAVSHAQTVAQPVSVSYAVTSTPSIPVQANSYGNTPTVTQSGTPIGMMTINTDLKQAKPVESVNVTAMPFLQQLLPTPSQSQYIPTNNLVIPTSITPGNMVVHNTTALSVTTADVNQTFGYSQPDLQNLNTLANAASLTVLEQNNQQPLAGLQGVAQPVQQLFSAPMLATQNQIIAQPLYTVPSAMAQQSFVSVQSPFLNKNTNMDTTQQLVIAQQPTSQIVQQHIPQVAQQHQIVQQAQPMVQQQTPVAQQQHQIIQQHHVVQHQPQVAQHHQVVQPTHQIVPNNPQLTQQSSPYVHQHQSHQIVQQQEPQQPSQIVQAHTVSISSYPASINQPQVYTNTSLSNIMPSVNSVPPSSYQTDMPSQHAADPQQRSPAQSSFLAAPELSPAVVQQILLSLKRTSALNKTQSNKPALSQENITSNQIAAAHSTSPSHANIQPQNASLHGAEQTVQEKIKQLCMNKDDPNVKKDILEATQKILQLRKQYKQYTASGNSGEIVNSNLQQEQQQSCGSETENKPLPLQSPSASIPDLPDLRASDIDSVLGVGETGIKENAQAISQLPPSRPESVSSASVAKKTQPGTGDLLINSEKALLSHLEQAFNVKSETKSEEHAPPPPSCPDQKQPQTGAQESFGERVVQSTYMNANRIAKERESKLLPPTKTSADGIISADQGLKQCEPVECGICLKKFNSLNEIKDHVKKACTNPTTAGKNGNLKDLKDFEFSTLYKCSVCNYMSSNKKISKQHVEQCSSNVRDSSLKAQLNTLYCCCMCSEVFTDKQMTYRHVSKLCPRLRMEAAKNDVQNMYQKLKRAKTLHSPSRLSNDDKLPNLSTIKGTVRTDKPALGIKTEESNAPTAIQSLIEYRSNTAENSPHPGMVIKKEVKESGKANSHSKVKGEEMNSIENDTMNKLAKSAMQQRTEEEEGVSAKTASSEQLSPTHSEDRDDSDFDDFVSQATSTQHLQDISSKFRQKLQHDLELKKEKLIKEQKQKDFRDSEEQMSETSNEVEEKGIDVDQNVFAKVHQKSRAQECILCDYICWSTSHRDYVKHYVMKHCVGCRGDVGSYSCRYCPWGKGEIIKKKELNEHVLGRHRDHIHKLILGNQLGDEEVTNVHSPGDDIKYTIKNAMPYSPVKASSIYRHLKAVAMRKQCAETLKEIARKRASVDQDNSYFESEHDSNSESGKIKTKQRVFRKKTTDKKEKKLVKTRRNNHRSRSSSVSSSISDSSSIQKKHRKKKRNVRSVSDEDVRPASNEVVSSEVEGSKLMLTRSGRAIRKRDSDSSWEAESSEVDEEFEEEFEEEIDSENASENSTPKKIKRKRPLIKNARDDKYSSSQSNTEDLSDEDPIVKPSPRVTRRASAKVHHQHELATKDDLRNLKEEKNDPPHDDIKEKVKVQKDNYELSTEKDNEQSTQLKDTDVCEAKFKLETSEECQGVSGEGYSAEDSDGVKVKKYSLRNKVHQDSSTKLSNSSPSTTGSKNLSVLIGPEEEFAGLDSPPNLPVVTKASETCSEQPEEVTESDIDTKTNETNNKQITVMESDDEFKFLQSVQSEDTTPQSNITQKALTDDRKAFDSEFLKFANRVKSDESEPSSESDNEGNALENKQKQPENIQTEIVEIPVMKHVNLDDDVPVLPPKNFDIAFLKFTGRDLPTNQNKKMLSLKTLSSDIEKSSSQGFISAYKDFFNKKTCHDEGALQPKKKPQRRQKRRASLPVSLPETTSEDTTDYDAYAAITPQKSYRYYKTKYSLIDCSVKVVRLEDSAVPYKKIGSFSDNETDSPSDSPNVIVIEDSVATEDDLVVVGQSHIDEAREVENEQKQRQKGNKIFLKLGENYLYEKESKDGAFQEQFVDAEADYCVVDVNDSETSEEHDDQITDVEENKDELEDSIVIEICDTDSKDNTNSNTGEPLYSTQDSSDSIQSVLTGHVCGSDCTEQCCATGIAVQEVVITMDNLVQSVCHNNVKTDLSDIDMENNQQNELTVVMEQEESVDVEQDGPSKDTVVIEEDGKRKWTSEAKKEPGAVKQLEIDQKENPDGQLHANQCQLRNFSKIPVTKHTETSDFSESIEMNLHNPHKCDVDKQLHKLKQNKQSQKHEVTKQELSKETESSVKKSEKYTSEMEIPEKENERHSSEIEMPEKEHQSHNSIMGMQGKENEGHISEIEIPENESGSFTSDQAYISDSDISEFVMCLPTKQIDTQEEERQQNTDSKMYEHVCRVDEIERIVEPECTPHTCDVVFQKECEKEKEILPAGIDESSQSHDCSENKTQSEFENSTIKLALVHDDISSSGNTPAVQFSKNKQEVALQDKLKGMLYNEKVPQVDEVDQPFQDEKSSEVTTSDHDTAPMSEVSRQVEKTCVKHRCIKDSQTDPSSITDKDGKALELIKRNTEEKTEHNQQPAEVKTQILTKYSEGDNQRLSQSVEGGNQILEQPEEEDNHILAKPAEEDNQRLTEPAEADNQRLAQPVEGRNKVLVNNDEEDSQKLTDTAESNNQSLEQTEEGDTKIVKEQVADDKHVEALSLEEGNSKLAQCVESNNEILAEPMDMDNLKSSQPVDENLCNNNSEQVTTKALISLQNYDDDFSDSDIEIIDLNKSSLSHPSDSEMTDTDISLNINAIPKTSYSVCMQDESKNNSNKKDFHLNETSVNDCSDSKINDSQTNDNTVMPSAEPNKQSKTFHVTNTEKDKKDSDKEMKDLSNEISQPFEENHKIDKDNTSEEFKVSKDEVSTISDHDETYSKTATEDNGICDNNAQLVHKETLAPTNVIVSNPAMITDKFFSGTEELFGSENKHSMAKDKPHYTLKDDGIKRDDFREATIPCSETIKEQRHSGNKVVVDTSLNEVHFSDKDKKYADLNIDVHDSNTTPGSNLIPATETTVYPVKKVDCVTEPQAHNIPSTANTEFNTQLEQETTLECLKEGKEGKVDTLSKFENLRDFEQFSDQDNVLVSSKSTTLETIKRISSMEKQVSSKNSDTESIESEIQYTAHENKSSKIVKEKQKKLIQTCVEEIKEKINDKNTEKSVIVHHEEIEMRIDIALSHEENVDSIDIPSDVKEDTVNLYSNDTAIENKQNFKDSDELDQTHSALLPSVENVKITEYSNHMALYQSAAIETIEENDIKRDAEEDTTYNSYHKRQYDSPMGDIISTSSSNEYPEESNSQKASDINPNEITPDNTYAQSHVELFEESALLHKKENGSTKLSTDVTNFINFSSQSHVSEIEIESKNKDVPTGALSEECNRQEDIITEALKYVLDEILTETIESFQTEGLDDKEIKATHSKSDDSKKEEAINLSKDNYNRNTKGEEKSSTHMATADTHLGNLEKGPGDNLLDLSEYAPAVNFVENSENVKDIKSIDNLEDVSLETMASSKDAGEIPANKISENLKYKSADRTIVNQERVLVDNVLEKLNSHQVDKLSESSDTECAVKPVDRPASVPAYKHVETLQRNNAEILLQISEGLIVDNCILSEGEKRDGNIRKSYDSSVNKPSENKECMHSDETLKSPGIIPLDKPIENQEIALGDKPLENPENIPADKPFKNLEGIHADEPMRIKPMDKSLKSIESVSADKPIESPEKIPADNSIQNQEIVTVDKSLQSPEAIPADMPIKDSEKKPADKPMENLTGILADMPLENPENLPTDQNLDDPEIIHAEKLVANSICEQTDKNLENFNSVIKLKAESVPLNKIVNNSEHVATGKDLKSLECEPAYMIGKSKVNVVNRKYKDIECPATDKIMKNQENISENKSMTTSMGAHVNKTIENSDWIIDMEIKEEVETVPLVVDEECSKPLMKCEKVNSSAVNQSRSKIDINRSKLNIKAPAQKRVDNQRKKIIRKMQTLRERGNKEDKRESLKGGFKTKQSSSKVGGFCLRDKPKRDYKELHAGKDSSPKRVLNPTELENQEITRSRKMSSTTQSKSITITGKFISGTKRQKIKDSADKSRIKVSPERNKTQEIAKNSPIKIKAAHVKYRMSTRQQSIQDLKPENSVEETEESPIENESLEEFKRRTESVKLAHRRFSCKPYECDFNFEEEGGASGKSKGQKTNLNNDTSQMSNSMGKYLQVQDADLPANEPEIRNKGNHYLRPSKATSPSKIPFSPVAMKLVSSCVSTKSDNANPIFSPHIFTCDNVKKFTRQISSESEKSCNSIPTSKPISVLLSENLKDNKNKVFIGGKSPVSPKKGPEKLHEHLQTMKTSISRVRNLRELHKVNKPFEWESGSPVKETRCAIKNLEVQNSSHNAPEKKEKTPQASNSSTNENASRPRRASQKGNEILKKDNAIDTSKKSLPMGKAKLEKSSDGSKERRSSRSPSKESKMRSKSSDESSIQRSYVEPSTKQNSNAERVTRKSKPTEQEKQGKSSAGKNSGTIQKKETKPDLKIKPAKEEKMISEKKNTSETSSEKSRMKKEQVESPSGNKKLRSRSRSSSQDKGVIIKTDSIGSKPEKRKISESNRNISVQVAKKQSLDKDLDKKAVLVKKEGKAGVSRVKTRTKSPGCTSGEEAGASKCKLDGTSTSPASSPVKPDIKCAQVQCDHIISQEDCNHCGKDKRSVYENRRASVRQIIHKGKVFEIQKGSVTETDIQQQASATSGDTGQTFVGPRTRAALNAEIVNSTVMTRKRSRSTTGDAISEKNIVNSNNINQYISETLKRIRLERESSSNQKWTFQKRKKIKSQKFPYTFQKTKSKD